MPAALATGVTAWVLRPHVTLCRAWRAKLEKRGLNPNKDTHTHSFLWTKRLESDFSFSHHFIHCVLMFGGFLCFPFDLGLSVCFVFALVNTGFIWGDGFSEVN